MAASTQAGVKLAKQAYDIIPNVIKGGRRRHDQLGPAERRRLPGGGGLVCHDRLAASGRATPRPPQFVARLSRRDSTIAPDDYTITAYDASLVIIDAVKRVAASGKPVTRESVRDAIQTAKVADDPGHGVVR